MAEDAITDEVAEVNPVRRRANAGGRGKQARRSGLLPRLDGRPPVETMIGHYTHALGRSFDKVRGLIG